MEPIKRPQISEFFAGKSALVTGATGFLGKALVEKILRSCPDINRLYLLVRSKGSESPEQRLKQFVASSAFDWLRNNRPEAMTKLVLINGDMTANGLGISTEDLKMLQDDVSVVFHSAGRVKFDDNLNEALEANVRGPQRLIELSKNFRNLKAFVHASTAYCHVDKATLDENIYPVYIKSAIDFMKLIDCVVDRMLPHMMKPFIGDCPNVYSFTKGLAEQLLKEKSELLNIPLVIVRPSIVTGSAKDPAPGWTDNFNGPAGLTLAVGKGYVKVIRGDSRAVFDLIPVDYVVNFMISAAWERAVEGGGDHVKVFNCTTGSLNPITLGEYCRLVGCKWKENPPRKLISEPSVPIIAKWRVTYVALALLFHYIPAFFLDLFNLLTKKKPNMLALTKKASKAMTATDHYTLSSWLFISENPISLRDKMSLADRETFYLDVRNINWSAYVETYLFGIRKYLVKDDPGTIGDANEKMKSYTSRGRFFKHLILLNVFFIVFCWLLVCN